MLKAALLKVFELAGSEIDHIPSAMVSLPFVLLCSLVILRYLTRTFYYEQYNFDITNAKKPDDRDEMYSRVSNMPALINLGS